MNIDENTKYIARLHKKASPRGLNIYNPFLDQSGLNALYILFYNEDPRVLVEGIKDLNFLGAITAGFESDQTLPTLLNDLDPVSKFVGKVGYIKNKDGKLTGYSQGGEGLLRSIEEKEGLEGKDIVIVGAGNVSKSLLFNIQEKNKNIKSITLVNRTVDKAEELAKSLNLNIKTKPITELSDLEGDLLVNATDLGGSEKDTLYTEQIINKYMCISDVTFETENTNLTNLAMKLSKKVSTGWDMFTYQGIVILENLFEQKINVDLFRECVKKGLSTTVV